MFTTVPLTDYNDTYANLFVCARASRLLDGLNDGRLLGEIMDHGDQKKWITEDGTAYDVVAVHIPNSVLTYALLVNESMQTKATRLLPIAQKMAESKATRASFYRATERSFDLYGGRAYAQAEEEARVAREQADLLFMVARGVSVEEKRVVTVEAWRKVLACFHQDLSLGATCIKE